MEALEPSAGRARRVRWLLAALLLLCVVYPGCAGLLPGTEQALVPAARFKGEEVLFVMFILLPATAAIDLLILPAFFATHDETFFFPISRAVLDFVLR